MLLLVLLKRTSFWPTADVNVKLFSMLWMCSVCLLSQCLFKDIYHWKAVNKTLPYPPPHLVEYVIFFFSLGSVRKLCQDLLDRLEERPVVVHRQFRVRGRDHVSSLRRQEPQRPKLHLRGEGVGQQDQPREVRVQGQVRWVGVAGSAIAKTVDSCS